MNKLNNRGSSSLIGLLVVVVIIVVAAAYMFGGSGGAGPTTVEKDSQLLDPNSTKNTVVGQAIDTGKASVCRQQLGQIRQGIQAFKASEGTEANPRALKDIGLSVGMEFFQCPVSNQPYAYDPAVGSVKCSTHTNF